MVYPQIQSGREENYQSINKPIINLYGVKCNL